MKKVLIFVICAAITVCAFSACSKNDKNEASSTASKTTTGITTDDAVIKEADAINLIQSYSDKELGLTAKERKKVSFMVASNGMKIDGEYYIEVVATIKNEHKNGDEVSYTFDHLGMYYIRYDGKKVMRKNMKSEKDEYIDMKIKAVPSTTAADENGEDKHE